MDSCTGCQAKDAHIAFLQAQVEKLQDRLLSPPPAPVAPTPVVAAPVASEGTLDANKITRDETGAYWYQWDHRKVDLTVAQRVLTEGGFIDDAGNYVSVQDWNRGMGKLNEMISGG